MKIELNNRVALVVGGTGTIGTAICKQLFASGARVVTDYHDTNIEEWKIKLAENGVNVTAFQADVTSYDECVKLADSIEDTMGPVDIIINSHEFDETVVFDEMEPSQWEQAISLNIDPLFNVCKSMAERMSDRGFGRIINISSIISRMGHPGKSHLAAAKASIHGFSMALAQEVARKGVTVNTVSPGLLAADDSTDPGRIPAGRFCTADEVAYLVDFLCSEQAGYINGADIAINGGQYLH